MTLFTFLDIRQSIFLHVGILIALGTSSVSHPPTPSTGGHNFLHIVQTENVQVEQDEHIVNKLPRRNTGITPILIRQKGALFQVGNDWIHPTGSEVNADNLSMLGANVGSGQIFYDNGPFELGI